MAEAGAGQAADWRRAAGRVHSLLPFSGFLAMRSLRLLGVLAVTLPAGWACTSPTDGGGEVTYVFVGNSTDAAVQITVSGPNDADVTETLQGSTGGDTFTLHLSPGDPVTFHAVQGSLHADLTCNIDASVVGSDNLVASVQILAQVGTGQQFHMECGSGWQ